MLWWGCPRTRIPTAIVPRSVSPQTCGGTAVRGGGRTVEGGGRWSLLIEAMMYHRWYIMHIVDITSSISHQPIMPIMPAKSSQPPNHSITSSNQISKSNLSNRIDGTSNSRSSRSNQRWHIAVDIKCRSIKSLHQIHVNQINWIQSQPSQPSHRIKRTLAGSSVCR